EARYDLMTAWCAANGCSHLFTGHHADDQVETFLMRLTRGSGVDGLAAIPASTTRRGVHIVRPLLEFTKAQLIGTCRSEGQNWIEDPSNTHETSTRVRFRNARAMLEREGLTRPRLLATVRHLRRAKEALDASVGSFVNYACRWDEYRTARVDLNELIDIPREIGLRALARVLIAASGAVYGPRFERLERLYDSFSSGPWRDATLHGCLIMRDGRELVFVREAAQITEEREIQIGETVI
ncbi:MAG: tRNA lysidine(34) synthetase TilS, partial [Rhodospirillaceae bacterium]